MRIKNITFSSLAFISFLSLQHLALADNGTEVKHYAIKQSTPSVGTNLTKEIVKAGTIPLNKRYDELTTEQKQTLRDEYDSMPVTDEPPFPVKGLYPIYKAIGTAHEALELQFKGPLNINVLVDSEGNPKSVNVMESPNEDVTKAAVYALMHQQYKPAVCAGQPCAMQFPLHADLVGPSEDNLTNINAPGVQASKIH
jgi:ribosomal protein S13